MADEHAVHRVSGCLLCRVVQVRINICGRGESAVSQPDLDLLHGYPIAEQQAGTGVSEIMESDFLQVILLDDPREVFCHIVWAQKVSALVHTDVVQIITAVRFFKESPEHLLLLLFLQQQILYRRDERQGSETGLGLENILAHGDEFSIHFGFDDLITL